METVNQQKLEAKFSALVMSIASSALMALGHSPHPETGQAQVDLNLARFNIDLLLMLRDKTKNNLNSDDVRLLEHIIHDLQQKYLLKTSKS